MRAKTVDVVAIEEVAVIVRTGDRLLLVQRPDGGRWAKMWEFPHHRREANESPAASADRLLAALEIAGVVLDTIATIRHSVTRYRITMACVLVKHVRGSLAAALYPDAVWIRAEDLHDYPLSTPQRRLARRLQELEDS